MQGSSINVASAPKTAMFQMRINPEIKREAEDVFSAYGLSLTDAFNIFLIAEQQRLSISAVPRKRRVHEVKGCGSAYGGDRQGLEICGRRGLAHAGGSGVPAWADGCIN